MPTSFEAVYEGGVLRPTQPLPFNEHEVLRLTVESQTSQARQSAGMLPWTGDGQTLRRLAEDPEYGIWSQQLICNYTEVNVKGTAQ